MYAVNLMAKQDTLLSLANIHAVNETGQSSVDIDRVNHQVVNVEAVNLPTAGGGEVTLRPFLARIEPT